MSENRKYNGKECSNYNTLLKVNQMDNNHHEDTSYRSVLPRIDKNFYKKCLPEETIHRIREILYKCDIYIMELSDTQDGFYHSHLHIANGELLQFGIQTNGKGMTPAYSLASAYAEMMERLQNAMLIGGRSRATSAYLETLPPDSLYRKKLEDADAVLDYEAFPDEQKVKLTDYFNSPDCIFLENQKHYTLEHADNVFLDNFELTCVPFYDVFNHKSILIPQGVYTSSNGMCAGNTLAEALVQGFCEIFERFALRKIMLEECVSPQIPLSYFEGTAIYEKIQNLQNRKIIVLDCSFGMKLPVVGALIIDTEHYRYRLMMAGAATATIALERCLTEHFQASHPEDAMHDIFSYKQFPNRTPYETHLINYLYSVNRCDGELDVMHLLSSQPDYEFEGFHTLQGDSHEEELSYIFHHILRSNHFDCFIRDNSTLGFPAFHIFVPGMSDVFRVYNDDDNHYGMVESYFEPKIMDLKSQSPKFLHCLADNYVASRKNARGFETSVFGNFLYNQSTLENAPNSTLFLATLYLQCKDYAAAYQQLQKFADSLDATEDAEMRPYFYCVLQYLKMKIENTPTDQIVAKLKVSFDESLVDEVLNDMSSENQLQYYDLPTCPKCERCPVANTCYFVDAMQIAKSIQRNTILQNQNQLITTLNTIIN
jgi:ribosomal protein S12 methylthiotransferase accessory factor